MDEKRLKTIADDLQTMTAGGDRGSVLLIATDEEGGAQFICGSTVSVAAAVAMAMTKNPLLEGILDAALEAHRAFKK